MAKVETDVLFGRVLNYFPIMTRARRGSLFICAWLLGRLAASRRFPSFIDPLERNENKALKFCRLTLTLLSRKVDGGRRMVDGSTPLTCVQRFPFPRQLGD